MNNNRQILSVHDISEILDGADKRERQQSVKVIMKNYRNDKDFEDRGQGKMHSRRPGRKQAARKKEQKMLLDLIGSKNYNPMRAKDIAFLLDVPKAKVKDMMEALDTLVQEHKVRKDKEGRYEKVRPGDAAEKAGSADSAFHPAHEDLRFHRESGKKSEGFDFREGENTASAGEQDYHWRERGRGAGTGDSQRRGRDSCRGGYESRGRGHGAAEGGSARSSRVMSAEIRNAVRKLDPDDPATALTEIVLEYGVPFEFPQKVLDQAAGFPVSPGADDIAGRLDLRTRQIITIDGDDSRDFDDAVSLERDGSGYILGVHIADVTNYVAAGSALDKEALKRGTSVYLADRVIPMLPEKLSNGVCSLNEGEDRLTLSCIVRMDRDGNIRSSRITESVICSSHRMTYSEVDRIFTENPAELREKYADVLPMLFDMKDLAAKLEKQRHERGMIDFEFPETKIRLDRKGHPVEIRPSYPTAATKLIEQFMLTANEVVAKTYFDKQVPFLYRTHENPDEDKIEDTLKLVRSMGIPAEKAGHHITPSEVQKIISSAEGTPRESLVSSMLLRSMQQARYTPENGGHFGLASQYYCHFTSPIRRYPDLQIHRIIKDDLHGNLSGRKLSYYSRILEDVAWKSSALERRSVEVERETNKIEMARYMSGHLGEVTEAQVTGVTGWGIYVQRPDTIEGLVHVSTLKGDYYIFDENTMTLTGKTGGRVFEIGQKLRVKAVRADARLRQIDFVLAEEDEGENKNGKGKGNEADCE
jgi:ribonuclease R